MSVWENCLLLARDENPIWDEVMVSFCLGQPGSLNFQVVYLYLDWLW